MAKKKLIEYHDVGLAFYEFLKKTGRGALTEKETLRMIYYEQFKRYGYGFGTVLYALKYYGKVKVIDGQSVFFKLQDQRMSENGRTQRCQMARVTEPKRLIADQIKIYSTDHQFKDGKMSVTVNINEELTVPLFIKNTGPETVLFTDFKAPSPSSNISLEDERTVTRKDALALHPGGRYEVCKVKLSAGEVSVQSVKLSFEFSWKNSSTYFPMDRFIEVQFMTELGKELAPTSPYRPHENVPRPPPSKFIIVFGDPPPGMVKMRPSDIRFQKNRKILVDELKNHEIRSERKITLKAPLSWNNYDEKFRLLLNLEMDQLEEDLKKCNIPNADQQEATMEQDNEGFLILKISDVIDNRPSVMRGDRVLVYPADKPDVKYCTYVDSVDQDSIKLGYNKELLDIFVKGMAFHIEFMQNSLNTGIQLRAVKLAVENKLGPVLFPKKPATFTPQRNLPDLKLYDRKLEENPEQYRAVQNIVTGSSKPAPYLVFGPPGTGKTVTVAEAIKQIWKSQPRSRILACAPTNSAADQLCVNLLKHIDQLQVFRIYAKYIKPSDILNELKDCSNLRGNRLDFSKYFIEKVMKCKVIVTTLHTSARFVTEKIPKGHFTHVFVDEAGHCMETECLLPLAGLLNPESGQLVLAGDPKQLGPIIRSPFASESGLGLSLLERLMKFPLYQKNNGSFDNRFFTKLLRNYRSHPAILKIPNELFYDGELEAFADEYERSSYCSWEHLPQKDFPIIFHEVIGKDDREASCPSYFNIIEVEVLMDYVKKLLQTQGKKGLSVLSPQNIGIITPYRKQVQKIRLALRKVEKDFKLNNISDIKVGSVEEFQGHERRVILISTVRSSSDYAEPDNKFSLEFIKNEKRFNVAVTRAKALLIVVGNSTVLSSGPVWERFINYCKDNGGYKIKSKT